MSILRNLRLTSIQPGTIFIRNLDKAISPTGAPRLKAHRWKPKAVGFGGGVSLAIENLLKEDTFAKRGVTLRDIVSYTLHDRTHIGTTDNTDAFLITGCLVSTLCLQYPKGFPGLRKGRYSGGFIRRGRTLTQSRLGDVFAITYMVTWWLLSMRRSAAVEIGNLELLSIIRTLVHQETMITMTAAFGTTMGSSTMRMMKTTTGGSGTRNTTE